MALPSCASPLSSSSLARRPAQSRSRLAGWTALVFFALLAWDLSGADIVLARWAGSAAGFPLRDDWMLTRIAHDTARQLSWCLVVGLCVAVWWPFGIFQRLSPADRMRLAVNTLLIALGVVLMKHFNPTSCPWELRAFGGAAEHISHWAFRPDGGSGHCFPAGHASSGFAFLSGYFAYSRTSHRLARQWLVGAVVAGLLLGIAQQVRGAHFMSHTLWSGWVCWGFAWALDTAWRRFSKDEAVR